MSSDGSVTITQQPGVTDSTGTTTAIVSDPNNIAATCTFQSSSFSNLVASFNIASSGTGTCSGGFSPNPH